MSWKGHNGMSTVTDFCMVFLPRAVKQKVFQKGVAAAIPNAVLAGVIKILIAGDAVDVLTVNQFAFNSFSGLIGLFLAFRAAQAYSRFWEGTNCTYMIQAEFLDVASSLIAFTRNSKAGKAAVLGFHHTMVRLFSILHVLILADLAAAGQITGEEEAMLYQVLDPMGLDQDTLLALNDSTMKVDLVFQWIQSLMVEAQQKGIINVPAPIATRAFQELNAGMVQFHAALKIADVPIPFPYTVATQVVLLIHWVLTPLVASAWSQSLTMCVLLSFVQVFMLWCLSFIASELENPFGVDVNDLEVATDHAKFDERLLMLLSVSHGRLPQLTTRAHTDLRRFDQGPGCRQVVRPDITCSNLCEAFRWARSVGTSGKSREELQEELVRFHEGKLDKSGSDEDKFHEMFSPCDSQSPVFAKMHRNIQPTRVATIGSPPAAGSSDVSLEAAFEVMAKVVSSASVVSGTEQQPCSETLSRLTDVLERLNFQLEHARRSQLLQPGAQTPKSAVTPAHLEVVVDDSVQDLQANTGSRSAGCNPNLFSCGTQSHGRLRVA